MSQTTLSTMQRIYVIGTSCSGKTTFAAQLAAKLGIPHTELDTLHWLPRWTERSLDEVTELVQQVIAQPQWIIDGNYSRTRHLVLDRADTVLWLNYSFVTTFSRAVRRTIHRSFTRKPVCNGNVETLRKALFTRDSILWWVIKTHRSRRRRYSKLFAEPGYAHLRQICFTSPRDAERFLAQSSGATGDAPPAAAPHDDVGSRTAR